MHPFRHPLRVGPLQLVLDGLRSTLGDLGAWKRRDPVSELVWGILSAGTARPLAEQVFAKLKSRFFPWPKLAEARSDEVAALIAPVQRASAKAALLPSALRAVRHQTGALRLEWLETLQLEDALDWLETLPGVTPAIAASVLGYSTLQRRVVIVDAAVERVFRRLKLSSPNDDARGVRQAVMNSAPTSWTAKEFAELSKLTGRLAEATCRSTTPDCANCALRPLCPTGTIHPKPLASGLAANENRTTADRLDGYLRRRIRKLESDGVSTKTLLDAGVSWGCAAVDAAFLGGKLPPGLHQAAGARMEDRASAYWPAFATAIALGDSRALPRLLVVQEADARREHGELHGPGMQALGLDPGGAAFVHPRDGVQALEITDEALRRRAAPVILLELRRSAALADLSATRRFNLVARRSGAFIFLVTPDLTGASSAVSRWLVASCPSAAPKRRLGPPAVMLDLVRNRAGRVGSWMVEWTPMRRRFQEVRDGSRGEPSAPGSALLSAEAASG